MQLLTLDVPKFAVSFIFVTLVVVYLQAANALDVCWKLSQEYLCSKQPSFLLFSAKLGVKRQLLKYLATFTSLYFQKLKYFIKIKVFCTSSYSSSESCRSTYSTFSRSLKPPPSPNRI